MKLIKPLLIYITWIAFVWLCESFIYGELINVFATTFSRACFLCLTVVSALPVIPFIFEAIENGKNNP